MNKLVKVNSSLVTKSANNINEYLKPMSRDIFLFTTKISNTYKLKDKVPLLKLTVGDKLFFELGTSKYEDNQIIIKNKNNEIVGYVPESDSFIFARLMSAGKMLFAVTKSISHTSSVPLIEIDIYLQDF